MFTCTFQICSVVKFCLKLTIVLEPSQLCKRLMSYIFFQFSLQVLKWLGGKQELLKEAYLQVNKQSIINKNAVELVQQYEADYMS